MKRTFILAHEQARQNAIRFIAAAPVGYCVTVGEPTRSLEQNAMFHAICHVFAERIEFAGSKRTPEQWKVLLISGHAVATKQGSEMTPGLEGEWVNLRESSAKMSKQRLNSLIEYALSYGAQHGADVSERNLESVRPRLNDSRQHLGPRAISHSPGQHGPRG